LNNQKRLRPYLSIAMQRLNIYTNVRERDRTLTRKEERKKKAQDLKTCFREDILLSGSTPTLNGALYNSMY